MLTKFLRLSPRERKLLFKALALLPIAVARVRMNASLPTGVLRTSAVPPADPPAIAADTVRMVKAAARYVTGATCLPQSLVVHRLLGDAGVPTTIRIGVRRRPDALDAHAWVEYGGRPITDPPAVHHDFTVLAGDPRS